MAVSPEQVVRLSEAIELATERVDDALEPLLDVLVAEGALRIHRSHSAFAERKQMRAMAAKIAVLSVLTGDWVDLPDEVRWLHIDRERDAAELAAAQ